MNGEMRWRLEAEMLYADETTRNETYSLITSNGAYPNQVEGEGRRLVVAIPSVNQIIGLRFIEMLTRFSAVSSNISMTKID